MDRFSPWESRLWEGKLVLPPLLGSYEEFGNRYQSHLWGPKVCDAYGGSTRHFLMEMVSQIKVMVRTELLSLNESPNGMEWPPSHYYSGLVSDCCLGW